MNENHTLWTKEPKWSKEKQKLVQEALDKIYKNVTRGICVSGNESKTWFCQEARNVINDLIPKLENRKSHE